MYSHNNFPLVPCVPVAKAPPIVMVLISGRQGIHQPFASIASSKSPKITPDCTVMVCSESLNESILLYVVISTNVSRPEAMSADDCFDPKTRIFSEFLITSCNSSSVVIL